MYAVRKTDVKVRNYQRPEERYKVQVRKGYEKADSIDSTRIVSIDEEVMFWRKAYHIHGWFVRNVQQGDDGYGHHYHVPEEKLIELRNICDQIQDASDLAYRSGFDAIKDRANPRSQGARRKVILDPTLAKNLLPISTGRFGEVPDEEYDEDYLQAVIATRDWLNSMFEADLEGDELTESIFYYWR